MMLLVDAGNTRVKWGLHDGAGWVAQGSVANAEAAGLAQDWGVLRPATALVSSVAGGETDALLRDVLQALGCTASWLRAGRNACGVTNGYADPAQLGSDRWAALVAAWNMKRRPCVVASAGSALTVDALSAQGEFLGGLIVPGLTMMKVALRKGAACVAQVEGIWCDFPTATGAAVHSGALAAMAGAVKHMAGRLANREGMAPVLIISGGDAPALQTALEGAGEIVDNLVLEGLVLLSGVSAR
jgi:type III pantothenate kinase